MNIKNRVVIVGVFMGLVWSSQLFALTLTNDEAYQLLSLQTQLFAIEGQIIQFKKVLEELRNQQGDVFTKLVRLQRKLIEKYGKEAEGLAKFPESLREFLRDEK